MAHISRRTRIPTTNIGRAAIIETIARITSGGIHKSKKIGYVPYIPVSNVLVKCHPATISSQHISHSRYTAYVPVTNRLIKSTDISKHVLHVCARRRSPVIDAC